MIELNLLKSNRNIKTFSAGEHIFHIGDQGDEMQVLQEGLVEIILYEQVVEVVEPGGILGEMVMISLNIRTATAKARTNCQLVLIKAPQFRFIMQESPYFAEQILSVSVGRVVKMHQMLFQMKF